MDKSEISWETSELGKELEQMTQKLETIKWSGNKKIDIEWVLEQLEHVNRRAYSLWDENRKRNVWVKGYVKNE